MNFRRITQTQTATLATVGEPTVSFAGRTDPNTTVGFATGNWYASLSTNAGASWTAVNPYTRFPAVDGGFCCDQVAIYEPANDMTVWYLQYGYSAATQRGSARVAYAIGAQLAANTWASYVFSPQGFGRPNGEWLDYPDMACSSDRIFFTSNIFNSTSNYTGTVIWTMLLSEFAAGSGTVGWWFTSQFGGGGSVRFVRGATDTMYAALHANTSTLRIIKITNGGLSRIDRTHPTWNGGPYSSLAPNGINWAGRIDSRITGAYATSKEYGFLWTAASTTGRPQPYTRVSRYRVSDDTHIADDDIWANDFAVMYPSAAANDAGHKCIGVAAGGAFNPGGYAILVDDCNPNFFGQTLVAMAFSNSPPTDAVWGDYTSVLRHPVRAHGFVMTGQGRTTGSTAFNSYAWVTRDRDVPTQVIAAIRSTPIAGVSMTCTADAQGRTSVVTDGYLSYPASTSYTVTAPNSFTSGSDVYGFRRWVARTVPYGPLTQWSVSTALNMFVGSQDDLAEAEYEQARRVDIGSRNPTSGITIGVSAADVLGNQNGTSGFSRFYLSGASVTLTAPAFHNTVNGFKRWWLDGVAQPLGVTTLNVNVATGTAPIVAEAEYYTFVPGTVATIGTGCAGSNALVPLLAATTPNAGSTVTFTTSRVFGPTGAVLYVGASSTTWNGTPLPLQLGFIGMSATCFLRTSVEVSVSYGIGVGGVGTLPLPFPATLGTGAQIYWQAAILDPLVTSPVKIIHSNALRTTIGGNL